MPISCFENISDQNIQSGQKFSSFAHFTFDSHCTSQNHFTIRHVFTFKLEFPQFIQTPHLGNEGSKQIPRLFYCKHTSYLQKCGSCEYYLVVNPLVSCCCLVDDEKGYIFSSGGQCVFWSLFEVTSSENVR